MANVKISELPVATSLSNGDSFPVVQGGVTKQAARSVLFASPTFTGATAADLLTATGDVTFDGGAFVFNESGADKDARFEGDTDANLLFLDASTDRVGIGTATPAAKLDVNGPASVTSFTGSTRLGVTVKGSTAATDYSGIDFSGNNQTVPTARIAVLSAGGGSSLVFGTSNNYAAGVTNSALVIAPSGDVGVGIPSPAYRLDVNGASVPLRFNSTNNNNVVAISTFGTIGGYIGATGANLLFANSAGSEAARITSGGDFGINGTPPIDSQFYSKNSAANKFAGTFENHDAGGYGISIGTANTNLAFFYPNASRAGSPVGAITTNGSSTSYVTSSDRRLKEGIAPAADAGPIIDAIEVVQHEWKVGGHTRFGVIAQDLNAVAPEAVSAGDDGDEIEKTWGVDYSKLVPMLIKEIQSLRARVAALEAG